MTIDTKRKLTLGILAVIAIGCQMILEATKGEHKARGYEQKRAAVELAARAFDAIREVREGEINVGNDPALTGLIGPRTSPISTSASRVSYKRTTLNPNLAAIIVDFFQQIGLEPGDPVPVSVSGSWPGTNINLYAAMEAMDLKPLVITSVGGSGFGATDPDFTWLDMEHALNQRGIFQTRSLAASPGGSDDMGGGSASANALRLIWEAADRNSISRHESRNLDDSIRRRMELYRQEARGQRIKAYVNVGGNLASLGVPLRDMREMFGWSLTSGLHFDLWKWNWPRAGTMVQLAREGVPVLHLGNLNSIAEDYALPVAPTFMPNVAEGGALTTEMYDVRIAAVLLVVYLLLTAWLVVPGFPQRMFGRQAA